MVFSVDQINDIDDYFAFNVTKQLSRLRVTSLGNDISLIAVMVLSLRLNCVNSTVSYRYFPFRIDVLAESEIENKISNSISPHTHK